MGQHLSSIQSIRVYVKRLYMLYIRNTVTTCTRRQAHCRPTLLSVHWVGLCYVLLIDLCRTDLYLTDTDLEKLPPHFSGTNNFLFVIVFYFFYYYV